MRSPGDCCGGLCELDNQQPQKGRAASLMYFCIAPTVQLILSVLCQARENNGPLSVPASVPLSPASRRADCTSDTGIPCLVDSQCSAVTNAACHSFNCSCPSNMCVVNGSCISDHSSGSAGATAGARGGERLWRRSCSVPLLISCSSTNLCADTNAECVSSWSGSWCECINSTCAVNTSLLTPSGRCVLQTAAPPAAPTNVGDTFAPATAAPSVLVNETTCRNLNVTLPFQTTTVAWRTGFWPFEQTCEQLAGSDADIEAGAASVLAQIPIKYSDLRSFSLTLSGAPSGG